MGKAIGLGGVFIHLKGDSKAFFDWYEKYLGLDFSAYGTGFITGNQLMVITFKRDDNPDMPYLNLRVDHLDEIIQFLKKDQIEIISDIAEYDYGKFATFKDPFGNVIELWEADEKAYQEMVQKELDSYKVNKTPKV
ncbi:MAG: VOC family protein [Acholeplasmataceae bacterium]|nr:VOC family protein [Acholeplasmataceae bacterium]